MSKPVPAKTTAPAAKAVTPPVAPTAAVAPANGEPKKAKEKRAKVRLISKTIPGLWVRAFVDVIQKFGVPKDPNGEEMVPGSAPRFGMTAEERERRKGEKEAEKIRFEAMSEEEKLAYAKTKREERSNKKAAKKAAEREALIAQLKAEMAAGKL